MDQPYSRIADALLDYQYWAPNDPQTDIYDDTAWTMGELANVEVVRVVDTKVLTAPMELIKGDVRSPGGISNAGSVYLINHNADNALVTLRYRLKDVEMEAAEEPFEAVGRKFNRGSFIIRKAAGDELRRVANELGIQVHAVATAPSVKTHPVRAARVAIMHTWLTTQDEGWFRIGFDHLQVPFTYISTQDVSRDPNLKNKYDVILFAPVGRGAQQIINGIVLGSGYACIQGTSMASPHSTGVAALIVSQFGRLGTDGDVVMRPQDVEAKLQSTTIDIGLPGYDECFGNGRIDASAAFSHLAAN